MTQFSVCMNIGDKDMEGFPYLNPIATMQVVCGATQKSLYDEWVCHDGYADMGPTTSGYADIGHTDGGQLIKNSFIF